MLIKVCGIAFNEDLISVSNMKVDYAGFIFVDSSPRYAPGKIDHELCALLTRSVPKMKMMQAIEKYSLQAIQLHGTESVSTCLSLREKVNVIKAFSIADESSFEKCNEYAEAADLLLFDTSGPLAGGNGFGWDWQLLENYHGDVPFLLSGGIGAGDILRLAEIQHRSFAGVDVNSRFELYPGKKNIQLLEPFVRTVKEMTHEFRSF
jgi:phosphoribosylanthranilate isomerase